MRLLEARLIICVSSVFLFISGCSKQTNLDVGGKSIEVPVPNGFTPLGENAPKFKSFITRFYPPGTVLIEYYLTDHDLKEVMSGHSKSRTRFLSIAVSRQMYRRELSEKNYLGVADVIRSYDGSNFSDSEIKSNEEKELRARELGVVPHLASNGKYLGVFLDRYDAIGVASTSFTRLDSGVNIKILNLAVTARVKDRYIQLECASSVNGSADVDAFEKICSGWVDGISRLNQDHGPQ